MFEKQHEREHFVEYTLLQIGMLNNEVIDQK